MDLEMLDIIKNRIKAVEKWIKDLLDESEDTKLVNSVPGIGETLSCLITLETGDINRFPIPEKYVSYAGLAPTTYASGGKVYHGKLLPMCNKWLRWAYITGAWGGIRSSPYFRGYFDLIKKRKGSNTAIVAVARRMTIIVWKLLKERRFYEEKIYKSNK